MDGHTTQQPASVSVATLNVMGLPIRRSSLLDRLRLIAQKFETSGVDVVAFQEVHTYAHLFQLSRNMPSFRSVSYRPSLAGPAGGLLTMARGQVRTRSYHRFVGASSSGLPPRARFTAGLKGTLLTSLVDPALTIINTHPSPNRDGDWSSLNRHAPMHRAQLRQLADIIRSLSAAAVVCGDFNVAADSELHRDFMAMTGLSDPFAPWGRPTFHQEYLPPQRSPHRIDFILLSPSVAAHRTQALFQEPVPLKGRGQGHVSDHLGLQAQVVQVVRPTRPVSAEDPRAAEVE